MGARAGKAPGHVMSKASKWNLRSDKKLAGRKPQNSTQRIWRRKGERNALACVRDRPQAHICPALSDWVSCIKPRTANYRQEPRAQVQVPLGEISWEACPGQGSWGGWSAESFEGEGLTALHVQEQVRPDEVWKWMELTPGWESSSNLISRSQCLLSSGIKSWIPTVLMHFRVRCSNSLPT